MTARRSLLLCFRHVSAVWHGRLGRRGIRAPGLLRL